jgi:tripartite-type tricarboxylate transporter receptor subunit TctC
MKGVSKMKVKILIGLLTVLFCAAAVSVHGAAPVSYPVKPIILQVPWPAGGSSDIGCRILAAIAEKKLGQPMVLVNKPGAGSQIGLAETARQKPDGYDIGNANLPALNTIILDPDRKATFTLDSFIPIINQVLDPGMIYVKADSPYKSIKDLIDDARKRPRIVRASTTGILGDDHLAILMLEEVAKINFRIVHFDGGATQATATMGGQVDVSFDNVGTVGTKHKAGQVRALAVMDKERSKFVPEVPTMAELGYPTVISSSTRGIMGPKGIPEPILTKLQTVLKEAVNSPEHIEKMESAHLAIEAMVGAEYVKFIRDTHERAKSLVEAARKAP